MRIEIWKRDGGKQINCRTGYFGRKSVPIADTLFEEFGFDYHTFILTNNTERERERERDESREIQGLLYEVSHFVQG